jgi:hypothetical protein
VYIASVTSLSGIDRYPASLGVPSVTIVLESPKYVSSLTVMIGAMREALSKQNKSLTNFSFASAVTLSYTVIVNLTTKVELSEEDALT